MILGIRVGMIIGLINGFVVVVLKIDSFIGTLGTGSWCKPLSVMSPTTIPSTA